MQTLCCFSEKKVANPRPAIALSEKAIHTDTVVCTDTKQLPHGAKLFQGLIVFFTSNFILPTQE